MQPWTKDKNFVTTLEEYEKNFIAYLKNKDVRYFATDFLIYKNDEIFRQLLKNNFTEIAKLELSLIDNVKIKRDVIFYELNN